LGTFTELKIEDNITKHVNHSIINIAINMWSILNWITFTKCSIGSPQLTTLVLVVLYLIC